VNDVEHMRHVIISLLKEIGYVKVSEAADGEMALRSFKLAQTVGAPINFVITDCAMPFMDGLSLIRSIRSKKEMSELPILMVTAEATKDNIISAAEAGADGYIVRPFKAVVLKSKIDAILAKKGLNTLSSV
jgi:two-component system chemotaxis response regulator CheY